MTVDLTPAGHTDTLTWRGVAGATGARLTSSAVTVSPGTDAPARSLGVVAAGKQDTDQIVVASPVPAAPVRAIRIPGLVRHEGGEEHPVRGVSDLPGDLHLVLAPIVRGEVQAPVVAVPPLPRRNALPAQLTGGSFSGSLLTLPDLPGAAFRVTVVRGSAPQDFAAQPISHGDITMYAAPAPVGLHVHGPDGAELFALAGPLVSPTTVDLRAALTRHLGGAVASTTGAGPVTATLRLRSDVVGRASVAWTTQGGVVERAVGGRLTVEVTGSPTAITLPPPRPGRSARRTVADVTVTHHGAAIHPLADPVPTADAGLGGPTVRGTAVVRALPPDALRGECLRRVGVVGWPRGVTDLRLEVLGATASVEGLSAVVDRALASTVWFDVGELRVDRRVELRLTATRGAFGWVADPEPLVRLATVTSPQGRRVTVGGHVVVLTGEETTEVGAVLAGTDAWDVVSDQLCTVSVANAVMEFAP